MSEQSDEIHLRKVLDGDHASFSYFVTRYKDMAFTVAISIVKNESIARELVQDAFVKAFRSLRTFKRQSLFSTWFYRIVMNEALMYLKKNKQEIITFREDYDYDIRDEDDLYALEETEQKHFINEALRQLAPKESLVLRLFYLREESIRTVCGITGMSVSNVKVTLHRARKNMFRVVSQLKNKAL